MASVDVEQVPIAASHSHATFAEVPIHLPDVIVEDVDFPAFLKSPKTHRQLFLAGAGVRCVPAGDGLMKVTILAFYYSPEVMGLLLPWLGKSADELCNDETFFDALIKAPVEKFSRVKMILPLAGNEFTSKVLENTKQVLIDENAYGEAEEIAIQEFHDLFSQHNFTTGAGPHYLINQQGIGIGFNKPGDFSTRITHFIPNQPFGQALLDTMIGKNGVSPASKASIADRLSILLSTPSDTGV